MPNHPFQIPALLIAFAAATTSCEHPEFPTAEEQPSANIVITFTPYTQSNFSRSDSEASLRSHASRLSVALFTKDGTRQKSLSQTADDDDFDTAAFSIPEGTYRLVAVAHNSTEGSATISSPEKITFANNKMTDTFSFAGDISVTAEPTAQTVVLNRVVAMFRISLSEPLPATIDRLKFYYTGGSSTLNPSTGYGCVNSKQTEYRPTVTDDGTPVTVYELFTAPHEQQDILKLDISALAADGSVIAQQHLSDIPVTLNKITTWQGALFSGTTITPATSVPFTLSLNTDWSGTIPY